MSLVVNYTLKDENDHAAQVAAMNTLVSALVAEGVSGVDYTCYATDDPLVFVAVMDFETDDGKQAFLQSAAFAAYREKVGPTFANPPQTTEVSLIATTRS